MFTESHQHQEAQVGRTAHKSVTFSRPTTIDSVSWIRNRVGDMQGRLSEAQAEIERLRAELARARSQSQPVSVPEMDLGSLRRQVAFFCHPDRGGDGALMSKLNTLFDSLEGRSDRGFARAA